MHAYLDGFINVHSRGPLLSGFVSRKTETEDINFTAAAAMVGWMGERYTGQ